MVTIYLIIPVVDNPSEASFHLVNDLYSIPTMFVTMPATMFTIKQFGFFEFFSDAAYSVSLSEKVIGEEEDCALFDYLPLQRGEVFLVFIWLRGEDHPVPLNYSWKPSMIVPSLMVVD